MILKKLNYIVLIIFVLGPISLKDVMDVWLGWKKKKKKKKNEKIFCLVEKKNERIKNEVRINWLSCRYNIKNKNKNQRGRKGTWVIFHQSPHSPQFERKQNPSKCGPTKKPKSAPSPNQTFIISSSLLFLGKMVKYYLFLKYSVK